MDPTRTGLGAYKTALILLLLFIGLFSHGLQAEQDKKVHGLQWWQSLADNGFASAQFHLAKEYIYGGDLNLPRDEKKALMLLETAAKQDYTEAQYELGLAYEKGRGTKQDQDKARSWYAKAAKKDHQLAQHASERLKRGTASDSKSGIFINAWNKLIDVITKPAMGQNWPWWLSGLALALIFVAYQLLVQCTLNPENSWTGLFEWKPKSRKKLDALSTEPSIGEEIPVPDQTERKPDKTTAVSAQAMLLTGVIFGGLLGSLSAADISVDLSLHGEFKRLMGTGIEVWSVLLMGGVLMGLGVGMLSGGFWSSAFNTRVLNIKGNLQYAALTLVSAIAVSFMIGSAAG